MANEEKIYLSASKIDKLLDCSSLYASRYIYKLPDPGNSGSSRGSTVHDVLELLLKPRHRKHVTSILKEKTVKTNKSVWKLITINAEKYNVNNEEDLDLINSFMLTALRNDFLGPKGTIEIFGEKEFDISVNEDGKRYNIRGFIDKTFKVKDEEGIKLDVIDYKSSKQKFSKEKINNDTQSLMYQLALKRLYPEINRRFFSFLFLKFPEKPLQTPPLFNDDVLDGFEHQLTAYQEVIEKFTLDNVGDNLASQNVKKRWLCGNASGTFVCKSKHPADYYVLVEGEKILSSAFTDKELIAKDNQRIEKRFYPGCTAFYNNKGKTRNFN